MNRDIIMLRYLQWCMDQGYITVGDFLVVGTVFVYFFHDGEMQPIFY